MKEMILTRQVNELTAEVAELGSSVNEQSRDLRLARASDSLIDGIMTYLRELNKGELIDGRTDGWSFKSPIETSLLKYMAAIGQVKLGGTSRCYFLLAYHHALMNLVFENHYHYPGLCIIDLPPSLPDGTVIADKENFLVEPFVALCRKDSKQPVQMIVAERSFKELEDVNRIELSTQCK
ncbi:MAG TPA: hypothetical protein VF553_21950 [Pyrinomonadaceae bacterium]|jgi:hypothetical protein